MLCSDDDYDHEQVYDDEDDDDDDDDYDDDDDEADDDAVDDDVVYDEDDSVFGDYGSGAETVTYDEVGILSDASDVTVTFREGPDSGDEDHEFY